jgi:hypothetical protein
VFVHVRYGVAAGLAAMWLSLAPIGTLPIDQTEA